MSGISAALAAIVLLAGIAGLASASAAIRPWLAVLLGINGGFGHVALGSLRIVNPIDIAALALSGVAFAGLWPGPGRPHKVWMGLAILLPFAGIAVLLATGLWGRSGLMGGGIVLSALMVASREWRTVGLVGFAANVLLLVGDFATLGSRSPLIAGCVAVGYALLIVWFVWIAARLMMTQPASNVGHT